jgi:hypothetical protein
VSHAHAWKYMKPHSTPILSDVIYPLMCHSDADERLWRDDPIEYVRSKYGGFSNFQLRLAPAAGTTTNKPMYSIL